MSKIQGRLTPLEFAFKAIETPFLSKGRSFEDPAGVDCFGLWYLAASRVLGYVDPPEFSDRYDDASNWREVAAIVYEQVSIWTPVLGLPKFGDLIVLGKAHVGLMIDSYQFYEIRPEWNGAKRGSIKSPLNAQRNQGIYRYGD